MNSVMVWAASSGKTGSGQSAIIGLILALFTHWRRVEATLFSEKAGSG